MYLQLSSNNKKRGRGDDEDELQTKGFTEHRKRRQMASLPFRQSPEIKKRYLPTQAQPLESPTVADITPTVSDSEDTTLARGSKTFFLPWSSFPSPSLICSAPPSPSLKSSQPSQMEDSIIYTNDLEMTDSGLLYPGTFQSDPATSISSRIPTPIHCQFSSHIRSTDRAPPNSNYETNFTDEETMGGRRSRRLPSPISEDETSSGYLIESLGGMQMEVESYQEEPKAATKKGHTRSKYSLRSWCGAGSDLGCGSIKRGFSMGYRSDCEKCRMRVPGHFSHIITY